MTLRLWLWTCDAFYDENSKFASRRGSFLGAIAKDGGGGGASWCGRARFILLVAVLRDRTGTCNFSTLNVCPPPKNTFGPRKNSMCLISWGRIPGGDPHVGRKEKAPTPKTRFSIWTLLRTPGRLTTRPHPVHFTTKMSVVRPFSVLSKDEIGPESRTGRFLSFWLKSWGLGVFSPSSKHKLFRGDFGVKKGLQKGHLDCKKFSLLLSSFDRPPKRTWKEILERVWATGLEGRTRRGSYSRKGVFLPSKCLKNPRAHKNKIGTSPPPQTQNTPPP